MYCACAKIWLKYGGASMIPWVNHIPKNQVCDGNSFRDIMKNVLRMRKDMAKIWGTSMIPWANHISKNQVCNVNSFRDMMKNVLRMRKDMAEIWRCFDDPIGQPYTQEPSL
ncbi:hypothetical protein AVEN_80757-1 [Araneus ventricosus]|uniref:Uncharacterized protein n=1 Tax=Araneus ventricosus TaxID=182803 RepID=A0A4Y2R556_ARAVE|nr:hypothetical protein AVEN_80757-1 [Araneus ventricosus]